jgi:hypothetical protein
LIDLPFLLKKLMLMLMLNTSASLGRSCAILLTLMLMLLLKVRGAYRDYRPDNTIATATVRVEEAL